MESAIDLFRKRAREEGFDTLGKEVVGRGLCSGCGMCAAVCPKDAIVYSPKGSPVLDEANDCVSCGLCAVHCPRSFSNTRELQELLFEGKRDELGYYRAKFSARATDAKIRESSQDGGVVSAILKQAFENELIDGAIVCKENENFQGQPYLARSWDEARSASGSKYNLSPNLLALKWAKDQGLERVALVGLPCHIAAYRKLEKGGPKNLAKRVTMTIGLFCSENFCSDMLTDFLPQRGIDPNEITKLSIKGTFLVESGGRTEKIGLKEMEEVVNPGCLACRDFTAELADISVGSVGAPGGWCAVIARTVEGEEILDGLLERGELERRKLTKPKTLRRLSHTKRKKGNERLIEIMREEAALPLRDLELPSEVDSLRKKKKKKKKSKK